MDDEVGILYLRCFINDISRYLSAIVCMTAAAAAAGNFFLPIPQQVSQSVSQQVGSSVCVPRRACGRRWPICVGRL